MSKHTLSRMCLGTASFGLPGYGIASRHRVTHEEAGAMLDYAVSRGVRVFDTGAAYGEAEDLVLSHVADFGCTRLTKLSPYLVDRGVACSRVNHWEGVLIHNPTVQQIVETDLLATLEQTAAQAGHSLETGVSVYDPAEAFAAIRRGARIVQVPYHVLDQRHRKAGVFEAVSTAGAMIMARQPWGQGLLVMDPAEARIALQNRGWHAEDAAIVEALLHRWLGICQCYEISPHEAALRFVLETPVAMVTLILFGVETMAQLQQDLDIAETPGPTRWTACYHELLATFDDAAVTLASVCRP